LNWWVVSQLERVNGRGEGVLVKSRRQFVQKVAGFNSRDFGFASTGARPGLYRLTVEIQNDAGKLVERHQEAYRALPAESDLRLSKSFESLAAGDVGMIRIDNYGTVDASFGENYRLWTASGEEVPVNRVFVNVAYKIAGGVAAECWAFVVPQDLAPGEYIIGSIARDDIKHQQLLTTSFVVN